MRKQLMFICACHASLAGCHTSEAPAKLAMAKAASDETSPASNPVELESGQPSIRALAELALQAIEARDLEALNSLRVTEQEYKKVFFPEFPEAQPGHNLSSDFQWFHLNMKSLKGLKDAIEEYGGQSFELMDIVVTQGTQEYKSFKAHKKVELKVRRATDGQELQIRVFGSVVERYGQFKIFSFPS